MWTSKRSWFHVRYLICLWSDNDKIPLLNNKNQSLKMLVWCKCWRGAALMIDKHCSEAPVKQKSEFPQHEHHGKTAACRENVGYLIKWDESSVSLVLQISSSDSHKGWIGDKSAQKTPAVWARLKVRLVWPNPKTSSLCLQFLPARSPDFPESLLYFSSESSEAVRVHIE